MKPSALAGLALTLGLALLSSTVLAAPEPRSYVLRLGEQSFDPLVQGPDLPAGWEAASGAPDLGLVQMVGPVQDEWRKNLVDAGLEVVQYIHPYTYIVWGDVTHATVRNATSFIRWTGPFAPAYRVLPRWRGLFAAKIGINGLLYRGADVERVLASLRGLGATIDGTALLDARFLSVSLQMGGDRLQAAAAIPGVYSLQPKPTDGGLRGEMSDQVNAGNVNGSNLATPGYRAWLTSVGVDGTGVRIADVDGGVQDSHPDLVNRIVACTGSTCGGGSQSSHGTHTAGIMTADGSSNVQDANGFLRGLGMAPGAKLVEQVYSPTFTQPGGMLLLMTQSYTNGASVSGNSWGPAGSPEGYDNDTMQTDIGVRDTDPNTAGNQPLSYVLSIMNGNGGTSTQGTPDEAKNLFTIGSTKMQNGNLSQIAAIDDISSNSAHGPALDGRKIPHMVAPGCSVDSTVTGSSHTTMCGTSMASPHVTGAVALFVQHYRNLTASDPSPALVKAAFLPVAHDLAGHLDADNGTLGHPFDSKQGWGRMNLAAVVSPTGDTYYTDQQTVLGATGEQWSQTLTAADNTQPVRMMLVWTDAPGHGLGGSTPAWNNDLDLSVQAGANTYLGNSFGADGMSTTGGTADGKNNTEGVFLPAGTTSFTVNVTAANINSDGVPNFGDATDQDFALVCYNCLGTPPLFVDGFETGDTSAWSLAVP